jgi:hypothetical protein
LIPSVSDEADDCRAGDQAEDFSDSMLFDSVAARAFHER